MRFEGTDTYVATPDLMLAVNAAITLQRPLLIKGEPGTGKTMLAEEVAGALGVPLLQWHIKSTTKAQQGLYEYDAVSRLRDSQLGDARVNDVKNYIRKGKLWQAFEACRDADQAGYRMADSRLHLLLAELLGAPQVVTLMADSRMRVNASTVKRWQGGASEPKASRAMRSQRSSRDSSTARASSMKVRPLGA